MRPLGDKRLYVRLLEERSPAVGTDLMRGYEAGLISYADRADMVQQCRGCKKPGHCRKWLATQKTAPAAPAYWSNHRQLQSLNAALLPERNT